VRRRDDGRASDRSPVPVGLAGMSRGGTHGARGRRAWMRRLCAAGLLLAPAARSATPQGGAGSELPPVQSWAAVECGGAGRGGGGGGQPMHYRNARFGFTMTYPSSFELDPDSIPEGGDSARFWTFDRRATAVVTGIRNGLGQSLADLLEEAAKDVTENSHGVITYTRSRDNWFVISGFMGERIFYRRSFLTDRSRVIGTLWIEFPRNMRPCFEDAVSMMSLSFRPSPT
jgi:hypothetical protein